jgi:hypothetical protein
MSNRTLVDCSQNVCKAVPLLILLGKQIPNLSNLLTHMERDPSLHDNSRVHLKLKTTQAKMQMKKIDLAELERAAIYLLLFTPKR